MARKYDHDPNKWPLHTDDEVTLLSRRENLYDAARRWGGSVEEWARYVNVSTRTIKRWLENPGSMPAESLDRTCELFGVSRDFLVDGYVFWGDAWVGSHWVPTSSEKDRMDAETMHGAYERLNEDNQRLVTSIVVKLLAAQRAEKSIAKAQEAHEQFVLRAMRGEISYEEWGHIYYDMFEADKAAEQELEEYERDFALSDARRYTDEAKRLFEQHQDKLRAEQKAIADGIDKLLDCDGSSQDATCG